MASLETKYVLDELGIEVDIRIGYHYTPGNRRNLLPDDEAELLIESLEVKLPIPETPICSWQTIPLKNVGEPEMLSSIVWEHIVDQHRFQEELEAELNGELSPLERRIYG